jgi:hypothetical protein
MQNVGGCRNLPYVTNQLTSLGSSFDKYDINVSILPVNVYPTLWHVRDQNG